MNNIPGLAGLALVGELRADISKLRGIIKVMEMKQKIIFSICESSILSLRLLSLVTRLTINKQRI